MIVSGMKKGEMRPGPFFRSTSMVASMEPRPPMPEPTKAPMRSAFSSVISRPLSSRAIFVAASAKWMKRSFRLISLRGTHSAGSKSLHSPAKWVAKAEASKCVMGPMPDRPATRVSHAFATPVPTGQTIPRPVTTTRRRPRCSRLFPPVMTTAPPRRYFL